MCQHLRRNKSRGRGREAISNWRAASSNASKKILYGLLTILLVIIKISLPILRTIGSHWRGERREHNLCLMELRVQKEELQQVIKLVRSRRFHWGLEKHKRGHSAKPGDPECFSGKKLPELSLEEWLKIIKKMCRCSSQRNNLYKEKKT